MKATFSDLLLLRRMSTPQLSGKGAIVTGGGSGICLSFTKLLHEAGYNVLICDVALHREAATWLETLKQSDAESPKVVFHRTDVTDWKQLEHAFNVYTENFAGEPYLLCPGAGVYEPSCNNFWNDRDENSYKILRINLEHPIKMSRIFIRRHLRTSSPGIILHVSSTGAQKSSIITPLYQAAKHGISNFVRSMAPLDSLANIRVVAVAPGPTMSPLMYDHPEAFKFVDPEKDHLATPKEIAEGMMDVCFQEKYPPGTVLEVTAGGKQREVFLLNDPGPGEGAWTSRKDDAMEDVKRAIEMDRGVSAN